MVWTVKFAASARKALKRAHPVMQQRILDAIHDLATDPWGRST